MHTALLLSEAQGLHDHLASPSGPQSPDLVCSGPLVHNAADQKTCPETAVCCSLFPKAGKVGAKGGGLCLSFGLSELLP